MNKIGLRKFVLMTPLLIPGYQIWFKFGFFSINLLEIWVLILVGWFLIEGFGKEFALFCLKWWKFFLLGVLVLTILVWKTPGEVLMVDGESIHFGKKVALGIVKSWVVFPFIFAGLLKFSLKEKKDFEVLKKSLVLSVIPYLILSFYQLFSGDLLTLDGRISGPFENANYLAMALSPVLSWLIYDVCRKVRERSFWGLDIIFLLSISFILILTQSYAAILSLFFGILLVLGFEIGWKEIRKRVWNKKNIIGSLMFVFFVLIFWFSGTEKGRKFFEFEERSSSSVRVQVYEVSWNLIKENWLFGIGPGMFQVKYQFEAPRILGKAPFEWVMLHPHNVLFTIWLNFGIFGVLIFGFVLFYAFKSVFGKGNEEEKLIRFYGFLIVIILVLHGLVDNSLLKNDLILFWVIGFVLMLFKKERVFSGVVIEGKKLGRKLGFPTLNVSFKEKITKDEEFGVFRGLVEIEGRSEKYLGAVHFGPKPAFLEKEIFLEVFLLNFNEEIYGAKVKVFLKEKIREIMNFDSLEKLKKQIENDVKFVKDC